MRGAPATCMSSSLPRVSEAPLPDCQTQAILRIGSGPSKVIRPHSAGTFEIDPGAKRPCPGSGDPHTLQLLGSCATDAHPRRRPVLRQAHRLLPGTLELARPLRGRARPPAAAFRGPSPPPPPQASISHPGPGYGSGLCGVRKVRGSDSLFVVARAGRGSRAAVLRTSSASRHARSDTIIVFRRANDRQSRSEPLYAEHRLGMG